MQWTKYADVTVALDLHVSLASFGTSFSLRNQTHLLVRLIDRRRQDRLAFSEVVWMKVRTKLIACPHLPGRNRSGNDPIQSKGGHIRIDVSDAIDGSQLSSDGGWRTDPAAYRRQRHICRDRRCGEVNGLYERVFFGWVCRILVQGWLRYCLSYWMAFIGIRDRLEGVLWRVSKDKTLWSVFYRTGFRAAIEPICS